MSRPTLSSLLNGKADLSGDMAVRFGKAFGIDMDTLVRMQASYDIARRENVPSRIHVARGMTSDVWPGRRRRAAVEAAVGNEIVAREALKLMGRR